MPSSVVSALIAFGAVLTGVSAVAGAVIAACGVLIELVLFIMSGMEP